MFTTTCLGLPIYVPNGAFFIKAYYLKEHKSFYKEDTFAFIMSRGRAHDINDEQGLCADVFLKISESSNDDCIVKS